MENLINGGYLPLTIQEEQSEENNFYPKHTIKKLGSQNQRGTGCWYLRTDTPISADGDGSLEGAENASL